MNCTSEVRNLYVYVAFHFLFVAGPSPASSDMCSKNMNEFLQASLNTDFSLMVRGIFTMLIGCSSCKITTDPAIICVLYPCSPCQPGYQCDSDSCFCSNPSILKTCPTCLTTVLNQNYTPGSDQTYSCQTLASVTTKPSNDCSIKPSATDFVIQVKARGKWNCFICMHLETMLACVLKC